MGLDCKGSSTLLCFFSSQKQTSCPFLEASNMYSSGAYMSLFHLTGMYRREGFRNVFLCKNGKNPVSCLSWGSVTCRQKGWVNHYGRRSLLQLTSFWELWCLYCIMRDVYWIVKQTPLGMSVENNLQDACLALPTVCTLWGITGWAPLRGASNKNFCLYREI